MSNPIPSPFRYRVAAIQYEPTLGEKEKNVRDLLHLAEEAAKNRASLIVLPEMGTTGYCWTSREEIQPFVESIPGPTSQQFQELAARYHCSIALALPEVDPLTQVYYNSMVLIGPKGITGTYRKIHSYMSEPRWARDGDKGVPVWDTELGRLSGLMSQDAFYCESARLSALHGADVLLLPSSQVGDQQVMGWWMARALENGLYVVVANRYGNERGVQFSGGSCIINPDGTLQDFLSKGDGIVYGEIDLQASRQKVWGQGAVSRGDRLKDRRPAEYIQLVDNTYLWEPLRYHGLYELGSLPPGQLSCVGFLQLGLGTFTRSTTSNNLATIEALGNLIRAVIKDSGPACPDVLVLPELLLPGPLPREQQGNLSDEEYRNYIQRGAIQIPGPETAAFATLAEELQLSMVLGVAEYADGHYYNSVVLIDPEGVYGTYRKLHLTERDRLWATPGNAGLPTFDTPSGRIGLTTGYDALFPETIRVLASKGADLVCAPTLLDFPDPVPLPFTAPTFTIPSILGFEEEEPPQHYLWRIRAAEHNVYLAVTNWSGQHADARANGLSGIFSPTGANEVIADEDEPGLMLMTIDTREQRTGRRTTHTLGYAPGDMAGSLTGELDYSIQDSIPGNSVRSKPMLRKRQPYWYLDLVKPKIDQ
ncbi:putative amidohydrolase [Thermosporothrix hazakensis]|jgi:predicted amidohydrolase|uniref:Amidohydrolase n=2 Tax=Thermosporothrix TaxID=768650 RepID=A0A455SQI7_9CHLR|nr:nitrilase-related carbon-nitrogen hydrolase [Thermosporothrix hazakensis]PZW36723.1 putative amidohydrolase [Thermosporothrix hazakensis]BBH89192.1 amidohydrolase [Thermosporothrix sp. COM3]GCE47374.1 amidohydrolase [Thermosporothrix hazakensis]